MKEGTDIADQKYSSKTKSRKWTTIVFSYLVDICPINAASVLAMNNHAEPRKQICLKLALVLV